MIAFNPWLAQKLECRDEPIDGASNAPIFCGIVATSGDDVDHPHERGFRELFPGTHLLDYDQHVHRQWLAGEQADAGRRNVFDPDRPKIF
jgi:hypothetical protein